MEAHKSRRRAGSGDTSVRRGLLETGYEFMDIKQENEVTRKLKKLGLTQLTF